MVVLFCWVCREIDFHLGVVTDLTPHAASVIINIKINLFFSYSYYALKN